MPTGRNPTRCVLMCQGRSQRRVQSRGPITASVDRSSEECCTTRVKTTLTTQCCQGSQTSSRGQGTVVLGCVIENRDRGAHQCTHIVPAFSFRLEELGPLITRQPENHLRDSLGKHMRPRHDQLPAVAVDKSRGVFPCPHDVRRNAMHIRYVHKSVN